MSCLQVNVVGLAVAAGGAEDLYRKAVLVELQSGGGKEAQGEKTIASTVELVSSDDTHWKTRCTLLVTVVAGASGDEAEDHHGVDSHPNSIKVVVEMTSGGDRASFFKVAEVMSGEVARTNRRWRRKGKRSAGEAGIEGQTEGKKGKEE